MEGKNNNRIKKSLKTTIALMAVAGLTAGATFALLSNETEKLVNTFTPGGGIELELNEPHWDPDGEAANFAPGSFIPKDPTITVPSTSAHDEYVAATVEFYVDKNGDKIYTGDEKVSYDEFTSIYADVYYLNGKDVSETSETYNTGSWYTDNFERFYFGTSSNPDDLNVFFKGDSHVLFDTVVVKKNIPVYTTDTAEYTKGTPIAFKIDVKAYGVQDSIDKETAKKALDLMIEGKDPNIDIYSDR